MTAYDESSGPLAIWTLLFAYVFLEYLNTYICFIFFGNILVFFFFFSLSLGYHYIIFWCRLVCSNGTFSFRYILRYHQSCYKRQNCSSTICFWLFFDFFFNFMFSLYFFDSWRHWGKLRTKEELLYQLFFLSLEFK